MDVGQVEVVFVEEFEYVQRQGLVVEVRMWDVDVQVDMGIEVVFEYV